MAETARVGMTLPTAIGNGQDIPVRCGRYGEIVTKPLAGGKYPYAEEGSYFVATSVIDTPITASIASAYSATASTFIFLRNASSATASQPVRIYLDYIKLLVKTIPGSAAEWGYACHIDNGASTFTSTGTNITPVNPNGDISATSVVGTTMYVGACVTTARTNGRLVARGRWVPFIPVTYDVYILKFGSSEESGGGVKTSATAAGVIHACAPPVIIPPSWNFTMSMYGTSNSGTAMTAEFEMGWWER